MGRPAHLKDTHQLTLSAGDEVRGRGGDEVRREGWDEVEWKLESVLMSAWSPQGLRLVPRPHPHPHRNYYLIFGLISETCLAMFLAFCPGVSSVLSLRGLRWGEGGGA